MTGSLHIYSDNVVEGDWFRNLSPALSGAHIISIKQRGQNPDLVDDLVKYDRPDIVLTFDGVPQLVVEKTREVPTGHNVGQRMARMVRATELKVPSIKFFPFDAQKHGTHSSKCHLNIRLLEAFEKMTQIHSAPVLACNWPCDKDFELIDDGTENDRISHLVHDFMTSNADPECASFTEQLKFMKEERSLRLKRRPSYAKPPPSMKLMDTANALREFPGPIEEEVRAALEAREESVVYKIVMTPEKSKRQDPYTGTQFIYDYVWCRSGPNVADKHRNLILHFPKITQEEWDRRNPDNPQTKSSNWYLTANAMAFRDGVKRIRD